MWLFRTQFVAEHVFLPMRVSSAAYALVFFNHETNLQGIPSFPARSLGKSLANEKTKEDFAPFIQIGQPKREPTLRLLFFPLTSKANVSS